MCSNGWDWDLGSLNFNSISATGLLHALAKITAWLFPFYYSVVKFISLSREKPALLIDTKSSTVGRPHSPQKTVQQLPNTCSVKIFQLPSGLWGCLSLGEGQHGFSWRLWQNCARLRSDNFKWLPPLSFFPSTLTDYCPQGMGVWSACESAPEPPQFSAWCVKVERLCNWVGMITISVIWF